MILGYSKNINCCIVIIKYGVDVSTHRMFLRWICDEKQLDISSGSIRTASLTFIRSKYDNVHFIQSISSIASTGASFSESAVDRTALPKICDAHERRCVTDAFLVSP